MNLFSSVLIDVCNLYIPVAGCCGWNACFPAAHTSEVHGAYASGEESLRRSHLAQHIRRLSICQCERILFLSLDERTSEKVSKSCMKPHPRQNW